MIKSCQVFFCWGFKRLTQKRVAEASETGLHPESGLGETRLGETTAETRPLTTETAAETRTLRPVTEELGPGGSNGQNSDQNDQLNAQRRLDV